MPINNESLIHKGPMKSYLFHSVVVVCASILICNSSYAQEKDKTPILYVDYENHALNSGKAGIEVDVTANDSIVVDCEAARKGKCSVKSLVKNDPSYLAFGALRSETNASKVPGVVYKSGDHFHYYFSLKVDQNWDELSDPNALDSIWQFKRFGSGPDMFLGVKKNSIAWRITESDQITVVDPLPRGKWIDFYYDVKWSENNDGYATVKVSVDGGQAKTYSFKGRTMRNAESKNGTVQWGLYKPGNRENFHFNHHSVNHDEIYIYRVNN